MCLDFYSIATFQKILPLTYINKGELDAGITDFDYAQLYVNEAECIRDDMAV